MLVERLVANEVSSAPCLTTEPDGELVASMHAESHIPCCACYHASNACSTAPSNCMVQYVWANDSSNVAALLLLQLTCNMLTT